MTSENRGTGATVQERTHRTVGELEDRVESCEEEYVEGSGESAEPLAEALETLANRLEKRGELDRRRDVLDRLATLAEEASTKSVREAYARALTPEIEFVVGTEHVPQEDSSRVRESCGRLEELYATETTPEIEEALAETLPRLDEMDESLPEASPHAVPRERLEELYDQTESSVVAAELASAWFNDMEDTQDFATFSEEFERDVEELHERHGDVETAAVLLLALALKVIRHQQKGEEYQVDQYETRAVELYERYSPDETIADGYAAYLVFRFSIQCELGGVDELSRILDELEQLAADSPDWFLTSYAWCLVVALSHDAAISGLGGVDELLARLRSTYEDDPRIETGQLLATGVAHTADRCGSNGESERQDELIEELETLHDDIESVGVRRALADALSGGTNPSGWDGEDPDGMLERASQYRERLVELHETYGDVAGYLAETHANFVSIHGQQGAFEDAERALDSVWECYYEYQEEDVREQLAMALHRDAHWHAQTVPDGGDPATVLEHRSRLEELYDQYPETGVKTAVAEVTADFLSIADHLDEDVNQSVQLDRIRTLYDEVPCPGVAEAYARAIDIVITGGVSETGDSLADGEPEQSDGSHDPVVDPEAHVETVRELHETHPTEPIAWHAGRAMLVQLRMNTLATDGTSGNFISILADRIESLYEQHGSDRIGDLAVEARGMVLENHVTENNYIKLQTQIDKVDEFCGDEGSPGIRQECAGMLSNVVSSTAVHSIDRADDVYVQLRSMVEDTDEESGPDLSGACRKAEAALVENSPFSVDIGSLGRAYKRTTVRLLVPLIIVGLGVWDVLPISSGAVFMAGAALIGWIAGGEFVKAIKIGSQSQHEAESLANRAAGAHQKDMLLTALLLPVAFGLLDWQLGESLHLVEQVWQPLVGATSVLPGGLIGYGVVALLLVVFLIVLSGVFGNYIAYRNAGEDYLERLRTKQLVVLGQIILVVVGLLVAVVATGTGLI